MNWVDIILAVHVPVILLLMFGIKWLATKAGVTMKDPERQWALVQKAVDYGIQFAEQKAGYRKKIDNPMSSEEKLALAKDLTGVLMTRFKVEQYLPAAEGVIEATLSLFGGASATVPPSAVPTAVSAEDLPGLDGLKLGEGG